VRWWWCSYACILAALCLCAYTFGPNNTVGAAPLPLIVLFLMLWHFTWRRAYEVDPVAADKLDAIVSFRRSRYDKDW
jgi:hypothetical protein